MIAGPKEGIKIRRGGGGLICKVDGIMCPFVEIGLTHFPKFGGPWPTLPHRPRQDWIVKSGEVVPALY